MDEDRIELVLARISELRSKITNCIATGRLEGRELGKEGSDVDQEAELDSDEATDCLLNIREALEKLELQVSSLQALQHQQLYEKEEALAGIVYSQEKLLHKLKEYKGENLDVIREAIAFVGETAEENNDLLLPPYPSRPSFSLVSTKTHISHFQSSHLPSQNGAINGSQRNGLTKDLIGPNQTEAKTPLKMVKHFVGGAAKMVLTVLGVISVLTLVGFEPSLKKRDNRIKFINLFQLPGVDEKERKIECPPGKVPVVENGEIRCVVRERVEVPFESAIATPDVSYGCG
ncbi:plastid division protein PDV2-like [Ipomoea triloba]|uniref:plastid division protein PDV2-like n=1 Tax=Ipomoea triloba TaxID=35885 RepID=UPI00125D8C5D|nr:plastid division protein PDV2-like [Ipomoea triloba]